MKISITAATVAAVVGYLSPSMAVYGFTSPVPVMSSSSTSSSTRRHVASSPTASSDSASVDESSSSLPGASLNKFGGEMKGNQQMRVQMETMLRDAQISITKAIEDIDGVGKFREDSWVRDTGGGGHSRVLAGGKVWEKAGVNLSVVHGTMPVEALKAATERGVNRGDGEQVPFFACGLSCVMHPRNPHCPTMHFNYRYFETDNGEHWWFGTSRL